MRRTTKVKLAVAHVPLRKAAHPALVAAPFAPRRVLPAWIDGQERTDSVTATAVSPRVRDGLVLRVVAQKKSLHVRNHAHGSAAR
jgi:hypothetical protein